MKVPDLRMGVCKRRSLIITAVTIFLALTLYIYRISSNQKELLEKKQRPMMIIQTSIQNDRLNTEEKDDVSSEVPLDLRHNLEKNKFTERKVLEVITLDEVRGNEMIPTTLNGPQRSLDTLKTENDHPKPVQPVRRPGKKNKNKSKPANDGPLYKTSYPPSTFNNYTCKDSMCSELMGPHDRTAYRQCTRKTLMYESKQQSRSIDPATINGRCHFINGTRRAPVAVVSFPGSGNTWVRGLLEQATGVCTGSVYKDERLRSRGMNGEGLTTGSVVVVKTHLYGPVAWTDEDKPLSTFAAPRSPSYGSALLIIRNPFDALVSEWMRTKSKGNHTGEVPPSQFGNNKEWRNFIRDYIQRWKQYFESWVVKSNNHPILVVKYEDIKKDVVTNVEKMLDFLGFPYEHKDLEEKLNRDYGTFKRKHKEVFEHFTPEQKSMIRTVISKTVSYLRSNNHGNSFKVEEYVAT